VPDVPDEPPVPDVPPVPDELPEPDVPEAPLPEVPPDMLPDVPPVVPPDELPEEPLCCEPELDPDLLRLDFLLDCWSDEPLPDVALFDEAPEVRCGSVDVLPLVLLWA